MQFTIHNGVRSSSYEAFLKPVRRRANLAILTDAQVERIAIKDGRAQGVSYRRGAERCYVAASCEVILAGGAINSPQLLMLSGIGPADHLRSCGIQTVHHLPGVGQNLHDHAYASLVYEAPLDIP